MSIEIILGIAGWIMFVIAMVCWHMQIKYSDHLRNLVISTNATVVVPNRSAGGKFAQEYTYAQAHADIPECSRFLSLASLYAAHPDEPTLALVEVSALEVRRAINIERIAHDLHQD